MTESSSIIIVLFVVGFALVASEVFLPGLILGMLGFFCLIASVIFVFALHGSSAGLLAAFLVGGLSVIGFILWLNFFPRTFIGRRLMLKTRQPADQTAAAHQAMIGASGEALTPLRPSGMAQINGKRVDVTAVGDFLESGELVVVTAADGMRVAVRRKDGVVSAPGTA